MSLAIAAAENGKSKATVNKVSLLINMGVYLTTREEKGGRGYSLLL
jgi:hypothetical protein